MLDYLLERDESIWDLLDEESEFAQETYLRDNLAKLEVYYRDLNYETVKTASSYGVRRLVVLYTDWP